MIRTLSLSVVVLGLVATACSAPSAAEKEEKKVAKAPAPSSGAETPAEAEPQAQAQAPQPQQGPVVPPVVRLLKAGSNPKQELRIDVAPDTKATLVTDLLIDAKLEAETMAQEQQLPAVRVIGTLAALSRAENGDLQFKYTINKVEILNPKSFPADAIGELQKELDRMNGFVARVTQSPRGIYLGWDYQLPQGMSPRSLRALQTLIEVSRRLSVPLPEEEVGVGAVWEAARVQAEQGISVEEVVTYKLLSLKGNQAKLQVNLKGKLDPGSSQLAGGQGQAKLEGINTTGKGEMTLDLKAMAPKTTFQISSTAKYQNQAGEKAQGKTDVLFKFSDKADQPSDILKLSKSR